MTIPKRTVPVKMLREQVSYDPLTGAFVRLKDAARGKMKAGACACKEHTSGYFVICILGTILMAHRAAWAHVHGEWPECHIDHINGNRKDNRLCNLRLATDAVNAQNVRAARKDNKIGLLGVSLDKNRGRWRAQISIGGKNISLGNHDTPELAHEAYVRAKRKIHKGCTI